MAMESPRDLLQWRKIWKIWSWERVQRAVSFWDREKQVPCKGEKGRRALGHPQKRGRSLWGAGLSCGCPRQQTVPGSSWPQLESPGCPASPGCSLAQNAAPPQLLSAADRLLGVNKPSYQPVQEQATSVCLSLVFTFVLRNCTCSCGTDHRGKTLHMEEPTHLGISSKAFSDLCSFTYCSSHN